MLSKNQEDIQTFIQTERLESEVMPSNQLNIQQENNNFIQSENLFTEQEILEKNKTRFNVKDGQETENYVEGDLKMQKDNSLIKNQQVKSIDKKNLGKTLIST